MLKQSPRHVCEVHILVSNSNFIWIFRSFFAWAARAGHAWSKVCSQRSPEVSSNLVLFSGRWYPDGVGQLWHKSHPGIMPDCLFLGWRDKQTPRKCLVLLCGKCASFWRCSQENDLCLLLGFILYVLFQSSSSIPPGTATWLTMSFCWSLGLCTSVPSPSWCPSAILWEVLSRWKLWTLLRHLQSSTMQSWWTLPWVSGAVQNTLQLCVVEQMSLSPPVLLSPAKPELCSREMKWWVMHSCGCTACGGWAWVQVYACPVPSFPLENQLALCTPQSLSRPAQW